MMDDNDPWWYRRMEEVFDDDYADSQPGLDEYLPKSPTNHDVSMKKSAHASTGIFLVDGF